MRRAAPTVVLAVVLAVVLMGCSSGPEVLGEDPRDPGREAAPPTAPPAIGEPVTTRPPTTALVVDDGTGPVACFGAVAAVVPPPRCDDGLRLRGWAWSQQQGVSRRDGVRWGSYALTGLLQPRAPDAAPRAWRVTGAVPASLYDAAAPPSPSTPSPAVDDASVRAAERGVRDLPGLRGTGLVDGRVRVEVLVDDGTLQRWADRRFGRGVVEVVPALVPAATRSATAGPPAPGSG